MKNKILRKVTLILTMCSLIFSFGLISVNAAPADGDDEGISPYTMYLSSGEITYQKPNSKTMRVTVTTCAAVKVASLYHDVVIYKNGTEVYRGRRYGANDTALITYEDFPASNGDFFSTYVTHYTSHNGYLEHCDTHHDQYFY